MKKLLEYILKNLVSEPKKIDISEEVEDSTFIYTIKASDEDKGKIIGKNGRVIKAIRDLLTIIARKEEKRVMLRVD